MDRDGDILGELRNRVAADGSVVHFLSDGKAIASSRYPRDDRSGVTGECARTSAYLFDRC